MVIDGIESKDNECNGQSTMRGVCKGDRRCVDDKEFKDGFSGQCRRIYTCQECDRWDTLSDEILLAVEIVLNIRMQLYV